MATEVITDPLGVEVTLTDERWDHILLYHPEMVPHRADLLETLERPGVIYEKGGHRFYFRRVISRFGRTNLHARVIPNPNHFVVTAWLMPELDVPEEANLVWFALTPL